MLSSFWNQVSALWKKDEANLIPLDQVSRFYQSDQYQSLDAEVKSAFFDGPLEGLDQRTIDRKDLQFMQDTLNSWQQGRSISCAMSGEKGTGLSTLFNQFGAKLKHQQVKHKIVRINKRLSSESDVIFAFGNTLNVLDMATELDKFIEQLLSMPPTVIMVDNTHFMVQRTLHAHEVIDALTAMILGTRGHHLWIVGCEEQAWRRLSYSYQFENLFSHVHTVANFTEAEIKSLLAARFAYCGAKTVNGVSLEQLAKDKSPLSSIVKKSKGCVELALFYCLNQLTHGLEPHSFQVNNPQDIELGAFKKLTQHELFTLAELAAHGQLSIKEHQKIFRTTASQSKRLLEHLRVIGLLDKTDDLHQQDAYVLKLIISAVVVRYLISMNYLY